MNITTKWKSSIKAIRIALLVFDLFMISSIIFFKKIDFNFHFYLFFFFLIRRVRSSARANNGIVHAILNIIGMYTSMIFIWDLFLNENHCLVNRRDVQQPTATKQQLSETSIRVKPESREERVSLRRMKRAKFRQGAKVCLLLSRHFTIEICLSHRTWQLYMVLISLARRVKECLVVFFFLKKKAEKNQFHFFFRPEGADCQVDTILLQSVW